MEELKEAAKKVSFIDGLLQYLAQKNMAILVQTLWEEKKKL